MGENFDKLLEAGYPFHPAFFVLTKGLSLSEVLKLAKRAIENDLKSQERHAMIMPFCILPTDDSTNKTELDDAVYKEFSSTDSFENESTQCEGWKIFKKIELDCDDGYVIRNCSFPILVHNIARTIVLINLYQRYLPKSNSSFKATRDVIRFCVLDTNTPDKNFEEAMDWLEENSFLLEHNSAIYFYKTISDFEKQNKLLFYLPYNYVGVKYEQVLFFHIKKSIKKKFPKANVIQYCSENSISEVKKDVCNVFLLSQYMDINRPECFPLLKVLKNEDKIFEVTPLFETFNDIILPLRCLWFYSIICEVTKKGKDNLFSQAEKVEKICWENVDINSLVRELNYAKA